MAETRRRTAGALPRVWLPLPATGVGRERRGGRTTDLLEEVLRPAYLTGPATDADRWAAS